MKYLLLVFIVLFSGCSSYIPYIRGGDCIDRAIVIRNSLRNQGYQAEIILGTIGKNEGHAWVDYKDKKSGKWITIQNY
jgi:hypothetical protein